MRRLLKRIPNDEIITVIAILLLWSMAVIWGSSLQANRRQAELNNQKQMEQQIQQYEGKTHKLESDIDSFTNMIDEKDKQIEDLQKQLDEYKNTSIKVPLQSRGGTISYKQVTFTLTFYTTLPDENGGYTTTCNGGDLRYGIVANNVLPQGTDIFIPGFDSNMVFRVGDTGGRNFDIANRLDVLVERLPNESKSEYKKRVRSMGVKTYTGYVISR